MGLAVGGAAGYFVSSLWAAVTVLLDIQHLGKVYAGAGWLTWALSLGRATRRTTQALDAVTLQVRAGEIVGLLGPNGSGKSSLLRCASGLLLPSTGTATVLGENPARITTRVRGRIGLVVRDDRSFNQRLSGRENLAFFAMLQQVPREQMADRIEQALVDLELQDVADRHFRYYSAGMKQRLSVARALLGDPAVLLMDEATSGLDPGKRGRFYSLLARLVQERGLGVLYATHDLTEAQYLCDRVLLLDGGRVVAQGAYLDVEPHAEALFRRETVERIAP